MNDLQEMVASPANLLIFMFRNLLLYMRSVNVIITDRNLKV